MLLWPEGAGLHTYQIWHAQLSNACKQALSPVVWPKAAAPKRDAMLHQAHAVGCICGRLRAAHQPQSVLVVLPPGACSCGACAAWDKVLLAVPPGRCQLGKKQRVTPGWEPEASRSRT